MDEKFWLKSRTILALIPVVATGLAVFSGELVKWLDAGHPIDGVFSIVWPAAIALFAILAGVFRAKATTTLVK